MKKIFACALCVVMTVSLCSCAGCRKKEETKAKEKETIELWHYWDIPDNQRHLEELVEQFNKMQEDIEKYLIFRMKILKNSLPWRCRKKRCRILP